MACICMETVSFVWDLAGLFGLMGVLYANTTISPKAFTSEAVGYTISLISSWRGKGLRVSIRPARGHEKCPVDGCGTKFSERNMFSCEAHSTSVKNVYLDITGKKVEKGRFRIYHSQDESQLQINSAIVLKQQIQQDIKAGTFSVRKYKEGGRELKFRQYKQKYLRKMRERSSRPAGADGWLSQSALGDIEKYHRNYLHHFDRYFIHDITKNMVSSFLDGLRNQKGELASNTIKKKVVDSLRHLLRWAHEEGDLVVVPELPKVKKSKALHNILYRDNQIKLLNHVPEGHRLILRWAMETGRRINEYRAMKVRDIDFKNDQYVIGGAFDKETYKDFPKVEEKGGAVFPLTPQQKEILQRALSGRVYSADDYVFLNPKTGGYYREKTLAAIFAKAASRAGLKITLNEFGRHSYAVQMLTSGATYTQVAVMLNNSADVVEKNYSRWNVSEKAKILEMRK